MPCQYPTSAGSRKELAAYLVHDLHVNPMQDLLAALSGTHKPQLSNGMITLNSKIDYPASLIDGETPLELPETAFVSLVIHCLALAAPVPVFASFLQAERLRHPTSPLRGELWETVAFLHVPPQAVSTALTCMRPDLIQTVQNLYGQWLYQCRNPKCIASALQYLVATPWHTKSGSKACRYLGEIIQKAQIAAERVKLITRADIIVDQKAGIIVSQRDKCFLALTLACGQQQHVIADEISAFAHVRTDTPNAFLELPMGMHPFDEL